MEAGRAPAADPPVPTPAPFVEAPAAAAEPAADPRPPAPPAPPPLASEVDGVRARRTHRPQAAQRPVGGRRRDGNGGRALPAVHPPAPAPRPAAPEGPRPPAPG